MVRNVSRSAKDGFDLKGYSISTLLSVWKLELLTGKKRKKRKEKKGRNLIKPVRLEHGKHKKKNETIHFE